MSVNEPMTLSFRQVAFGSGEYYQLVNIRYEVLRKPLGWEMRPKDVATDPQEFHLAAYNGETPIACALLRPEANTVQLRQVSVLDAYQNKGIGTKLVKFAEDFAKTHGFTAITARARKDALKFYNNLGYANHAYEFEDEHTLKVAKPL